jgi:N-acyl-D-amino-acid deacylase
MRGVVDMVNEARARGVRITADQYPFLQGAPIDFITDLVDIPEDLEPLSELRRRMWRARFSGDDSAQERDAIRSEFVAELQRALRNEAMRARLRESTYEPRRADPSAVARWGWQDFRIKVTDEHPELLEKTLDELVEEQGRDGFDIVADLVLSEPDMLFASASQSPDDMRHAMKQDWVMISSDGEGVAPVTDGAPPVRDHPRSFASQSVALRRYVREEGLLSLADAVRKMTSLPAQFIGMKDRGLLLDGFKADIVVFDPETISDHATYADAHQYATGVELVLVNGVLAVENGNFTGALAGEVLLKNQN